MLASEVIKRLQELIEEHGDCPVIDTDSETVTDFITYDKTIEADPPEAFIISFVGSIGF